MCEISVIIPVYNGEKWIDCCMHSIAAQSILEPINCKVEIVVYNDGSNDNTESLLEKWKNHFSKYKCMIPFMICGTKSSKGVGAAKNGAVKASSGKYLCFQDIDDIMDSDRILYQYEIAKTDHTAIVGCKIKRIPENSTPRFVQWANRLTPEQLKVQIYTSNGPSVLMPTWFCHRSVYQRVGGFNETGQGTPEDLIFFYAHLDAGGNVQRVDRELLIYRYHEDAATFSVSRESIWRIQLERLEKLVLPLWQHFTVWNAGKAGRRLVRSLCKDNLIKVLAFCDVDLNKVGRTVELYCPILRKVFKKLPVLHFSKAKPPLIICVKLDMTNGQFERNLKSLNLIEGTDYILFS